MFLRRNRRTVNGECYEYWTLVRTVRTAKGPRQEIVATLGKEPGLESRSRHGWEQVADLLEGRTPTAVQGELGQRLPDAPPPQWAQVDLRGVRVERVREFGQVYLGLSLWRRLGLHTLLKEIIEPGQEQVPWDLTACILTLARFCGQRSELEVAERWYADSVLEDLLGVSWARVNDARLYRGLDVLYAHKDRLCTHLLEKYRDWFGVQFEFLLYDVTSTYFEGQCASSSIARRGYSRDHRPDCLQVNIALVVTRGGMPLGYEIFPGNTADVMTVEEIVEAMEKRFGKAKRVWVMDRGMVSAQNIAWLNETGRLYVIGTPKSELKRWARQLAERADWRRIREDVEVKICRGPEGNETFLLCRSAARAEKERAMHERFCKHIEAGLERMAARIAKAKHRLDRGALERQIGRLLERNARAAARYSISIEDDGRSDSGLKLKWSAHPEWDEWANLSEGTYILRTNVHDWTDEELWRTYIQLTEAEAAFRIHKSDLAIRPIWHQKAERIKAHILVCFLGYALWKTLQQWQSRASLGDSPRTILTELSRITSGDIVLPLADGSGRELRIRCVVRPGRAQALLIDRLGLKLPERLRAPQTVEM